MQKRKIISLPFLDSFTGFPSRNRSSTRFSLLYMGQFRRIHPSPLPPLNFSTDTSLLALSNQHLDLSFVFPGTFVEQIIYISFCMYNLCITANGWFSETVPIVGSPHSRLDISLVNGNVPPD